MADGKSGNPGLNKLAVVLSDRTRQLAKPDQVLDFGVVLEDLSIKLDGFSIPVPAKDYHVLRSINWGTIGTDYLTETDEADVWDYWHKHNVKISKKTRSIHKGDHVLCAWVNRQLVVIDIVMKLGSDSFTE